MSRTFRRHSNECSDVPMYSPNATMPTLFSMMTRLRISSAVTDPTSDRYVSDQIPFICTRSNNECCSSSSSAVTSCTTKNTRAAGGQHAAIRNGHGGGCANRVEARTLASCAMLISRSTWPYVLPLPIFASSTTQPFRPPGSRIPMSTMPAQTPTGAAQHNATGIPPLRIGINSRVGTRTIRAEVPVERLERRVG